MKIFALFLLRMACRLCVLGLGAGLSAGAVMAQQPALTLAQRWDAHTHANLDLSAYWVSEKYDGIRAFWDGSRLISRQGQPIDAPVWFVQGLGAVALEGELWAGRGRFACVQSAVGRGAAADALWRGVRWMVFDAPAHEGDFAERQRVLRAQVQRINRPWIEAAAQWQVRTAAQLQQQLQQFTQAGAEGLMLRRADAPYRAGRSGDLLKVKLHDDAEAVVVAHLPGKGRLTGLTGALLVRLPDGRELRLGSGLSDADRRNPPPVGAVVTYRHSGWHASGLPRFARFWRVREDVPVRRGLDADGAVSASANQAAGHDVQTLCQQP